MVGMGAIVDANIPRYVWHEIFFNEEFLSSSSRCHSMVRKYNNVNAAEDTFLVMVIQQKVELVVHYSNLLIRLSRHKTSS